MSTISFRKTLYIVILAFKYSKDSVHLTVSHTSEKESE